MSFNNDISAICEYCGVCYESRIILWEGGEHLSGMTNDQKSSLKTFQGNLIHFFGYYDTFMTTFHSNKSSHPLLFNLAVDFDTRAVQVFHQMAYNFIVQLNKASINNTSIRPNRKNEKFIKDLLSGDPKKTLKLVPSRGLARELGMSDIHLRREIYMARQRALNKRPVPKRIQKEIAPTPIDNDKGQESLNTIMDVDIPTCASPASSTTSSYIFPEEFDFIGGEDCLLVEEEENDDGWTVIKGWLNSDLIDY